MPVVIVATTRTWTSVNAVELNDNILNDGIFEGPTYISRDELGVPPDEMNLYKSLGLHCIRNQVYSTSLTAATVLSRFISNGYKIASQAGTGIGTSGKARYSADVSVTDYRWIWTLVKEDHAPPPYVSPTHGSMPSTSYNGYLTKGSSSGGGRRTPL